MNQQHAIESLAALAHESRLAVYRLLVREQPDTLAVGEISRRLGIVASTLSGHLGVLKRAGLVASSRHQREIHYAARLESIAALVRFLLEDCCDGRVENCKAILSLIPGRDDPQRSRA